MNNDETVELLKRFRSYEYVAMNCGTTDGERMPMVISERMKYPNTWDRSRYNRIVNIVRGAVEHILSEEQALIIKRKYLDKNKLTLDQIAAVIKCDPSTVSRWHKTAINELTGALSVLDVGEAEITPFDHFFDEQWKYKEPKESA